MGAYGYERVRTHLQWSNEISHLRAAYRFLGVLAQEEGETPATAAAARRQAPPRAADATRPAFEKGLQWLRSRLKSLIGTVLVLLLSGTAGAVTVRSEAEVMAALKAARGGETIALAPGRYGALALNALTFATLVTITAADPAQRPVIGGISIDKGRHLRLERLILKRPLAAGEEWQQEWKHSVLKVKDSHAIAVVDVEIVGSDTGDLVHVPVGAFISESQDITFATNHCHDLMRCTIFRNIQGLRVTDNRIERMRSDGLNFSAVQDVVIENNVIAHFPIQYGDWHAGGDHKDFIQFWTRGTTTESADVVIRGNVMIESGTVTQGLFISSENDLMYQRFLIEENTIYNSSHHGITLNRGVDSIVRNNTVIPLPGRGVVSGITVGTLGRGVTVHNNVAGRITVDKAASATVLSNILLQWERPEGHDYFGSAFVNAYMPLEPADLVPLPDGPAARIGSGPGLSHRFKPALFIGASPPARQYRFTARRPHL
ncbi:MAG: hypothetical protein FD149_2796 [Rhodospirillaceae bacterium]|nr:MAG: hypothetical protein FD149_2796 [Rhodospirillaceae bacterium]